MGQSGASTSFRKVVGLVFVLALLGAAYYFKLIPSGGSSSAVPTSGPTAPVPTPVAEPPTSLPSETSKPAFPASKPTSSSLATASDALEIRVGSWNIEWLGKPEDRSGAGKDVAQDPSDLADLIVTSRVAVLGVCEIVSNISGRPIRSREIESTIDVIKKKTGDAWQYVLYPGRKDGDQLTGVLWNPRIVTAETAADQPFDTTKDTPWPVPVGRGRSSQGSGLFNRPPHAMKFSAGKGKTDFVVVVLHLKADYNGDFAQHRKEEADVLVSALPAVRKQFHDEDILLVGDTNCTGDHEPAIIALEKVGYFDLNASHRATHWRGGSMDRELVPVSQPEFAAHAFEIMSDSYLSKRGIDAREYKRRFSDHFMVVGTIKVMADDD